MNSRIEPATIAHVHPFAKSIFLGLSLLLPATTAVTAEPWLERTDFDEFHVVLGNDPNRPTAEAARLFAESCAIALGYTPAIVAEPDPSKVNVWIGPAGYDAYPSFLGGDGLSREGYVIRTLDKRDGVDGRHLLLVGNSRRATIYAVWTFLETYLGVRALAPDSVAVSVLPKEIPRIDRRIDPEFWYRDVNYRPFIEDRRLAAMNHLNGQWTRVPNRYGGHIRYVRGLAGHGHTFHYFVDPEEYFDDHPEYFAEIEGERIKYAQLCLTNEDVLAITIEKVRSLLRDAHPDERIVSVSQMDYFWFDSWCTCDECAALDELEESHAGSLIHFVNAVADGIADEFPDAYIDTLAYLYTRTPPKHVRPRDNVIVRLCGIECDYSVPLTFRRSQANRRFVRDLKRWRAISSQLFIWFYTQNWFAFQAPHPTTPTFQPNLEFMREVGVDGVFLQASPDVAHSDLEALKSYLLGRLIREPELDWRALENEFLNAWYGDAAPAVHEYVKLLRSCVERADRPLWFINNLRWLDVETVVRARGLLARASAEASDPETQDRIRRLSLAMKFAAMVCPPDVYRRSDAYVFVRPPAPTFDEYWTELQALGVTHLNDHPIDRLARRMDGVAPPRYEIAEIRKLKSPRFEAWIVPARGGGLVRLRDRELDEEWLSGYHDIRGTGGRLQPWTTTDPDRWTEPGPEDEPWDVVSESAAQITLERTLDNGLVVRNRLALHDEGVEVILTTINPTDAEVLPKVGLFGEFVPPDGGRAKLFRRFDRAWSHVSMPGRFSRGVPETETAPNEGSAAAIAYPSARRSLTVAPVDGMWDTIVHDPESSNGWLQLGVKMPWTPIPPGEQRTVVVNYRFENRSPNRR